MVGLLDIAPGGAKVTVRGAQVDVTGVSASGIAHLLATYPDLLKLFAGQAVEPSALMAMGGDIIAAIIAAGTGAPGDAGVEAVAASLSADEQADLLAAILKLTMPGGVGPFAEKLAGLGSILGTDGDLSGKAQATKSAKPSKP